MKLNFRILIVGIILTSLLSCENKPKKLTPEYLVGTWTYYLGNSIKNGEIKNDSIYSKPMRYEFKKNGEVIFGSNNVGHGKWIITEGNKLIMNDIMHEPLLESKSQMILNNENYSYHFRKGWTE